MVLQSEIGEVFFFHLIQDDIRTRIQNMKKTYPELNLYMLNKKLDELQEQLEKDFGKR